MVLPLSNKIYAHGVIGLQRGAQRCVEVHRGYRGV